MKYIWNLDKFIIDYHHVINFSHQPRMSSIWTKTKDHLAVEISLIQTFWVFGITKVPRLSFFCLHWGLCNAKNKPWLLNSKIYQQNVLICYMETPNMSQSILFMAKSPIQKHQIGKFQKSELFSKHYKLSIKILSWPLTCPE